MDVAEAGGASTNSHTASGRAPSSRRERRLPRQIRTSERMHIFQGESAMNSRISIVAIAISLALSGCATPRVEQTGTPIECNVHQPVCPIVPVTVVPDPVVGCKVTMANDVEVSGPGHHIFWELDPTSPYTFAPNDG